MRVAIISEIPADSLRAHAINVVKTAGGFARLGHEATVLCRSPAGVPAPNSIDLYAEPDLHWRLAPEHPGSPGHASEAFADWSRDQAGALGAELVYARHFHASLFCAASGLATVLETHAHAGDPNPLLRRACEATNDTDRPLRGIITISDKLADYYKSLGAGADAVHTVPDGVDLDLFLPPALPHAPPDPLRGNKLNAVYAGHLYEYKGIPTIIGAAQCLPHITFHLLGGTPEDVASTRAAAASLDNIRVHGAVPHAQVPPWLWHASCLLLPPGARHPSAAWTSPVKLGEYLAAGPPLVASDIPGLRDWVAPPAVRWFRPDDATDLARAIAAALAESDECAAERREHARSLASRYSYPARAAAIVRAALRERRTTHHEFRPPKPHAPEETPGRSPTPPASGCTDKPSPKDPAPTGPATPYVAD